MPPLIAASPNLIDQSFPRSREELSKIESALLRIIEGIQNDEFKFLLVDPLRSFIQEGAVRFDWSKMPEYPGLLTIYNSLSQLGLQQAGVETHDFSHITDFEPHPIPDGTPECIGTILWSDEMGRACKLHYERQSHSKPPFVGVGCAEAFSGNCLGRYLNPNRSPYLPLVGPSEIRGLSDAEEWDLRPEWGDRRVSFEQAKTNIKLLGGRVRNPSNSSHYEVQFPKGRTWPLDSNYKEVPEKYIRQLTAITGIDLKAIKYTLCEGKHPRKRSKLAP